MVIYVALTFNSELTKHSRCCPYIAQKLASYRPSLNLRSILPHMMIIPSSVLHLQSSIGQGNMAVVNSNL